MYEYSFKKLLTFTREGYKLLRFESHWAPPAGRYRWWIY